MTQLFLTSVANIVLDDIVKRLPKKPTDTQYLWVKDKQIEFIDVK